MRIKMKRLYTILIGLCLCLSLTAQTASDVINKVKEIREESGDSIARNYLINNHSIFTKEDEEFSYLLTWGLLTSNMWNENPSDSLTIEYKKYLDDAFDEEAKSPEYVPEKDFIPSLWQLARDYYNILYRDGDRETVYTLLTNIHRWFKPYPELRNTIGYAKSLMDLCLLLVRDMHKYQEGEPFVKEYEEVAKSVYGDRSPQYAVALYNLCYTPSLTYEEKTEILKRAISIYEVSDNQNYAMLEEMKSALNSVTSSLSGVANTGNIVVSSHEILSLSDCESLILSERGAEAIASLIHYKNILSEDKYLDTLNYSRIISDMITAYLQDNELAKGQKEIEDFNKKIGIDNIPSNYAQLFYSSAGHIAMRLKDYPKALRYAHAACRLSDNISVPAIEFVKSLANISLMYAEAAKTVDKQFYLDAKWYVDEAIDIFEDKVGPLVKHGSTGLLLLNNKALVYDAIGDRNVAIESLEAIVNGFSDNNEVKETWALAANNLATLYMQIGHPEKAIDMLESLSSKNNEYNLMFKQNLTFAYYISNNNKLKNTLKEYNNICYNNCMDVFNFFTEAEREAFWTGNARDLLAINNLVADKHPEMTDIAFDNLLFVKNLKLMSADILKKMVENSSSEELKKKYNHILSLRDAISYRINEKDSIKIWNQQLNDEERSIITLVPKYKELMLESFHSWNEIKEVLKGDEIAVDFTYVPKLNDENWGNSDFSGYYGAFVVTNNSKIPELISLCDVDSINQYLNGSAPDAQQISILYKESLPIFKKVWGNLEKYIKDKKTIYFSPTGQLNLLNHNALVMPDGKMLGERYNLVRLSSTDKILSLKSNEKNSAKYQSAVVYGGIQYDLSVADMKEAAKEYSHRFDEQSYLAMRSEDERGQWNYLPGTKAESQNIYNLLSSNNILAKLLQDKEANEESFKALSGKSTSIIHLSTHGFFLDTKEKVKKNPFMNTVGNYSEKEDNLIRTGVLMAGANNVWCGRNQVTDIEDGILTADEISRLDLSGTNLVVLSACETAKGQIDPIDGVLGLQRGLKKAGVGSILMSLWKVSDAVTSILMTEFYTNLGNGMDLHESLKKAAQKVKDNYPDPYFWAAFVILD